MSDHKTITVDFSGVSPSKFKRRRKYATGDEKCLTLKQWLERELDPLDPLLGDLLSTTARILLYADTGVGKTMLALTYAFAQAYGRNFMHWKSKRKAQVLYVDGEMPRDLMQERLELMKVMFNLTDDEIAEDRLKVLSTEDHDDMPPVNTEEGQKWLDHFIKNSGPFDFIFFDNIATLSSGIMKDEDSWREVVPYTKSLTKRHIGQAWLHHTGHDLSRGYGTKTREWTMDTVMTMEATPTDDDRVSFNLIFKKKRRSKPSNYEDFQNVHLELIGGQWVGSEEQQKKQGRPGRAEDVAHKALKKAGRPLTQDEWVKASIAAGISTSENEDSQLRACERAFRALDQKGKVERSKEKWCIV